MHTRLHARCESVIERGRPRLSGPSRQAPAHTPARTLRDRQPGGCQLSMHAPLNERSTITYLTALLQANPKQGPIGPKQGPAGQAPSKCLIFRTWSSQAGPTTAGKLLAHRPDMPSKSVNRTAPESSVLAGRPDHCRKNSAAEGGAPSGAGGGGGRSTDIIDTLRGWQYSCTGVASPGGAALYSCTLHNTSAGPYLRCRCTHDKHPSHTLWHQTGNAGHGA